MGNLDWLPKEDSKKNHHLWEENKFSEHSPGIIFEKRPIVDPKGKTIDKLYSAWIILNNPKQYNSYTTDTKKRKFYL